MKFYLIFSSCSYSFSAKASGFSATVPVFSLQIPMTDSLASKMITAKYPANLSVVSGSIAMAVTGISIMTYLSGFGLIFGGLLGIFAVVIGIRGLIRHEKLVKAQSAADSQARFLGNGKVDCWNFTWNNWSHNTWIDGCILFVILRSGGSNTQQRNFRNHPNYRFQERATQKWRKYTITEQLRRVYK